MRTHTTIDVIAAALGGYCLRGTGAVVILGAVLLVWAVLPRGRS